ncbi:hypothetical protein SADUNF_Sadunf15G0001500 [Salix dunnii]|uniref:Uncharacterized protein n=1 Tax=Salix dunnii TaxID=1413687 RepID=A0A835MN98_9ROSI|nr:hypothetical protein SADUNF_Sadunf15G0001500 [Salix dunnii]
MMMLSTLLIHFLLITTIALFSVPTARSDANPIRLPALDRDDDDDACGEWRSRSPVSTCPVKCFRPDPVCGVNGVTYWCGCDDARCAGTKVAKKGFCEVGNNGAAAQALLLVHIVWLIVLALLLLAILLLNHAHNLKMRIYAALYPWMTIRSNHDTKF